VSITHLERMNGVREFRKFVMKVVVFDLH
jgi:hypothetical protein